MTANRDLHTPEDIAAARVSLGKQLAAWRAQARIAQHDLARRMGYSRSAVASAESGAPSSASFWRAADPVVGAQGTLIAQHARIDAAGHGSPQARRPAGLGGPYRDRRATCY